MKPRWRKGTALLQTLVMSILLSMIAVSLMKWVLARYMIAARNYRSAATTTRVGGYTQAVFSSWNFGGGPVMPALPDGKSITYQTAPAGTTTRITMTSDEDQ
ncbi:MAG: hypothetical protein PHV36_01135 [Elusimicrobiales bacterium]|nr:hypothetical protein [Elusimicrobiales bacterium]